MRQEATERQKSLIDHMKMYLGGKVQWSRVQEMFSEILDEDPENTALVLNRVLDLMEVELDEISTNFFADNLIWGVAIEQHADGRDMSELVYRLMGRMERTTPETIGEMLSARSSNWMVRDKHLLAGAGLFLEWCERNNNTLRAQEVFRNIAYSVVAASNREYSKAHDVLEGMMTHLSPREKLSPDGGPRRLEWVWLWATSQFDAVKKQACPDDALRALVRWGIDLEAKNEDGQTVLEWAVDKEKFRGGGPKKSPMVESLVGAGAHWRELYNSGDEATRGILRHASGVRAELLGEMASLGNTRAEAKQPPRAMKM